jgi:predicted PurR-regulated permease PerM
VSCEKEIIEAEPEILGNDAKKISRTGKNRKRCWSVFVVSLMMMVGLLVFSGCLRSVVDEVSAKAVKKYYLSEINPAKSILEKYSGMPFRDIVSKLSVDERLAVNTADKDASLITDALNYLFFALQLGLAIFFSGLTTMFLAERKSN